MATSPIENQRYIAAPFARVGVPGSQESNLNTALRLLAELSLTISGADGAAIALAQEGKVLVRASAGNITRQPGARVDRDNSWSDLLLRRSLESIFCVDTEQDRRVNTDISRSMELRSMIVLPLYGRGSLVAVLEAYWRAPYGFTNREISSLTRVGDLVLRLLKAEGPCVAATPRMELQAQNHPTTSGGVSASNTKLLALNDVRDIEGHQGTALNHASDARNEPRVPMPPANRIEVVIRPSALEEELTSLPVDYPGEMRVTDSRNRYQWGVVTALVFAVMLTTGIWWRVEASQVPQIDRGHHLQGALPDSSTNHGPAAANPGNIGEVMSATPDSPSPAPKPAGATAALETQPTPSRITGIHYSSSRVGSTVILDLEGQPTYQADTATNPTRIFFDLQNTSLSADLTKPIPVDDMLLARIRSGRLGSATRIVLDAKQDLDFRVQMLTKPSRMIIDLRSAPVVK